MDDGEVHARDNLEVWLRPPRHACSAAALYASLPPTVNFLQSTRAGYRLFFSISTPIVASMSQEYSDYLAINVLNEQQLVCLWLWVPCPLSQASLTLDQVSYRSLSRALKVHSNLAKQYVAALSTVCNAIVVTVY